MLIDVTCDCGYRDEILVANAGEVPCCPVCRRPLKRVYAGNHVGLVFKGEGFYVNDYKGSNSTEKE